MEHISLETEINALKAIYEISTGVRSMNKLPEPGILYKELDNTLYLYVEYSEGIMEFKIGIPSGYPQEELAYDLSNWFFDAHLLSMKDSCISSRSIGLPSELLKLLRDLILSRLNKRDEPMLFEMTEILRSYHYNLLNKERNNLEETKSSKNVFEDFKVKLDSFNGDLIYGITHGEPIIDRKSVFQAHVCKVYSTEEVEKILKWLLSNSKIERATHNIWSYRLCRDNKQKTSGGSFPIGYDVIVQDHDSDGETAAGGRLQHLLNVTNAKNVFVMVSRWYGGIQLGPDRFKHINNAARLTLEKCGLITSKSNNEISNKKK
ncbi:hypothetical protein ACR3K2_16140 [Cryptosporidium serpentis]